MTRRGYRRNRRTQWKPKNYGNRRRPSYRNGRSGTRYLASQAVKEASRGVTRATGGVAYGAFYVLGRSLRGLLGGLTRR